MRCFWVRPIFEKSDRMTPKWHVQSQRHPYHTTYTHGVQIFVSFKKSALMVTPKLSWHLEGQKYPYAYHIHPSGLNFCLFCSTMIGLTKMTTKWPCCLCHFVLLFFSIWPNSEKSAHKDPETTLTISTHHVNTSGSLCPNGHPFHCTMSCLRAAAEFSENAWNDPKNGLYIFEVKSNHMSSTYTAEAQIFIPFALQ